MIKEKNWYRSSYRRMLVDMHIPDWNEKFLSRYDPKKMAELYQKAGLTSVMFYCQSHVGLCYWPTKIGKMHAGLKGRDVVAELLKHLKAYDIASCAYYSVVYNNWAFLENPEWRMVPAGGISFADIRYGLCCPNNPNYRKFVLAQIDELVHGYDFEGFFFDMTLWPVICLCQHCQDRFRKESGKEIPNVIDWISPDWCEFQRARERWISDFAASLTNEVKKFKPRASVYHNFAVAFYNWTLGLPLSSSTHHDFLGADFYGDSTEQFFVSKVMLNLSKNRPVEFMTSCCANLMMDHTKLKSRETMETQAFAATLFAAAFLFIDAVNIDGTVNSLIYDRIGRIFHETAKYEPYLGGEPVEEIAIYFSNESKMNFAENGLPLSEAPIWKNDYPHLRAARGACRILQQAHLPFGIITKKQLSDLDHYQVIILPDLLRIGKDEVKAFRDYVYQGGKIYASRYTSLTDSDGKRHTDFMLADIFGCHFANENAGLINYLKPATEEIAACIAPQKYVGYVLETELKVGLIRLAKKVEGKTLATLTLPYASPERGTVLDQNWASIHSSPPWEDTSIPVVVSHGFGKGRIIYSAVPIESAKSEVHDRLFLKLVSSLLDTTPVYTAEAHPDVWMTVFHQPKEKCFLIGFLNYQSHLPAIPIKKIPFTLRNPEGKKFTKLLLLPKKAEIEFRNDQQGTLRAEIGNLSVFQMLMAKYE